MDGNEPQLDDNNRFHIWVANVRVAEVRVADVPSERYLIWVAKLRVAEVRVANVLGGKSPGLQKAG